MSQVTLTKNTKLIDERAEVLAKLNQGASPALAAAAQKGVELVMDKMLNGYGKPIRQTGDLMRDVNYRIDGRTITWGNSLEYAPHVHEGTSRMNGRPYLRDGIIGGADEIKNTFVEYMNDE